MEPHNFTLFQLHYKKFAQNVQLKIPTFNFDFVVYKKCLTATFFELRDYTFVLDLARRLLRRSLRLPRRNMGVRV